MGEGWRFRLLGPLEVRHDGTVLPIAAAKQRVLIAVLALAGGEPVPAERLIECLWGDEPPITARNTLKNYVLRLRRTFQVDSGLLATSAAGYRLDIDRDAVDVHRFQDAIKTAKHDEASLDEALALWQGQPLADVPSDVLHREVVPGLMALRLAAREHRVDLDLNRGRHRELVDELLVLATENPLREGIWARLMLALYRSGRPAEALDAYRRAGEVLAEELGVDPGPELKKLHQAVLTRDPALTITGKRATVPRQLPAATAHFVGRNAELAGLSARLPATPLMVISAIAGTAGVGKTTLAVHWGHQHADRFPDGQLYVNLRGFGGTPVQPATAVRGFLTALGQANVPTEPDDQFALYRSLLAERRMLVVLDNARDADQVRPLLPGTAGCVVLVTSRDQLAGLVALDGAVPLTLDLFTHDEARDMLVRRLGDRVEHEQAAVDELIEACARLPIALNIVAAQAVLNPTRPLAALAEELRDARRRLDVLGSVADVRTVFSWSYQALSAEAARVFRLLGLHPGPDIGRDAAADLAALDLDRTDAALAELTRAHLVTEHAGRHTMHDLLRSYAADQARDDDRPAALRRVVDYYLHTAHAADRAMDPHRRLAQFDPPGPDTHPTPIPDAAAAMTWFDAEDLNLVAAQQLAVDHGWHGAVWQLAWEVSGYHLRRGRRHDRVAMWRAAADAAEQLGDPIVRLRVLRLLGRAYADVGRHEEAREQLELALAVAEQAHDLEQQAHTHVTLAIAGERHADYRWSLTHALQACQLFEQIDRPVWKADALNLAGWMSAKLGEYDATYDYCGESLTIYRDRGDTEAEATVLDSLALAYRLDGRHRESVDHYQQALVLFRRHGVTNEIAQALDNMAQAHLALGEREQARAAWQEALEVYRRQDDVQNADLIQERLDALW
ncbi:AfsR/SARP family transcriptional regulator [Kutzneria chonburiensis]|uniref:BTAD domain-containing putative transcriptional regulator n=1 Tax=Kutzneria chonburiensis TaxID=1483604 RepID=A0ABV6N7B4_9PSEU|nr:BTAD domain-containing putative transcriptional regulator [Kutzneria chonburiensis]